MNKYVFIFCFLTTIFACQIPSTQDQTQTSSTFFDLKQFFEEETAYLNNQKISVQKDIQYNNQKETKIVQIKNWKKELKVFSDSDINKPSWKDKYTLDSTNIGNGLSLLHYKAIDESLNTQILDIKFINQQVHSILIVKKMSNQVYESQQYLTYIPRKSYSIKKMQNVTTMDKEEYQIDAKYIYS